jgi:hypothetical protein
MVHVHLGRRLRESRRRVRVVHRRRMREGRHHVHVFASGRRRRVARVAVRVLHRARRRRVVGSVHGRGWRWELARLAGRGGGRALVVRVGIRIERVRRAVRIGLR